MRTIESLEEACNASGHMALDVAEPASQTVATTRVLHVINGEHYSGAERVQDLLALRLPDFGVEAAFACVKPDRFPRDREAVDAQLYELPMRGRLSLGVARELAKIVRQDGFQIVHAHTPRSALVGRIAALLAGVPFVYHVHSPTARDSTHKWRNRLNNFSERLSLFGAAALIPVSHSLGRHMRLAGYPSERIAVVPNGVPATACRRGVDMPSGTWILGTVALFRPRKGLEVLIDALARLKSQDVAVRLLAVGAFETPDYEAAIKQQANRLGVSDMIDWTGFTTDVTSALCKMDLFVLPSLFGEGLPMVVLEAMAAGVPVVGTRVEGVPEAIDDGVSGLLVEPGEADALATGVARIVGGEFDWSSLRANAIRSHQQRFSDHQMARQVADVYRAVLSNTPLTGVTR